MLKSWNEITIAKWKEINQVQTEFEVSRLIEILAILTDRDPDELRQLPVNQFRDLQSNFGWTSTPPEADIVTTFELKGKKYGIIPQLDFISAGEWLDAESWKDDSIANIHLYSALIYRPITKEDGDTWEIEPHKPNGFLERANLFLNELPITRVYGAVLFFLSSAIVFSKNIQEFLLSQQKSKPTKMKQTRTPTKKRKKRNSTNDSEPMI